MASGFGFAPPHQKKVDKLEKRFAAEMAQHCQNRDAEALTKMREENVLVQTRPGLFLAAVTILGKQRDIDTLAWLCGYYALEANKVANNTFAPVTLASKLLIMHGLIPFGDFLPWDDGTIQITTPKYKNLPPRIISLIPRILRPEKSPEELQWVCDELAAFGISV